MTTSATSIQVVIQVIVQAAKNSIAQRENKIQQLKKLLIEPQ